MNRTRPFAPIRRLAALATALPAPATHHPSNKAR